MVTFAPHDSSTETSGDLLRQLINDADLINTFSPIPVDEQQELLGSVINEYDQLDESLRESLQELLPLLGDAEGQLLRNRLCKPGRAVITVDDDRQRAYLEMFPPEGGGKALATNDVITQLREFGIHFGVDMRAVNQLVHDAAKSKITLPKTPIATGRPPVNGEPGRIDILGEDFLPGTKKIQKWMTAKGNPIARLIPPTPGTPGIDVFGQPIPATPGHAPTLKTEGPISLDEPSHTYTSDVDGLASFDGQTLELRRQMLWQGDYTRNDPPIKFDGCVSIRGNVRSGARIEATENIDVTGNIEGATVISSGGGIIVKQGIAGRNQAFISATRTIDVRYIENAIVYCAGDVQIGHGVINSKVVAGGAIRCELGKGAVFGGELRAGLRIAAKTFGNLAGVPTKLSVGYSWVQMEKLREQEASLATLRQQKAACDELVERFARARPDLNRLAEREKMSLAAILKRKVLLAYKITLEERAYEQLDNQLVLEGCGEVVSHDSLLPGTTVKIGSGTLFFSTTMSACTLRFHPDKKEIIALSPSGRALTLQR